MNPVDIFIGQSLKNILNVGSFVPSSYRLAKRMAKDIKGPIVLELGPGTGVFTKEILKRLPKDGLLISIENNEAFVEYLHKKIKDDRFRLYTGDALHLREFLDQHGISRVNCIVSGLPLANFKTEAKEYILREIYDCLEDNGTYIQFQYLLAAMNSIKKVFPTVAVSYELFNIPPAFVMKCKKIAKNK